MIVISYNNSLSFYCVFIWCWRTGESTHQHGSLNALLTSFNYKKRRSVFQIIRAILTDSSKDDVTAESVIRPVLILARTGAPKPIEESCRLVHLINNTS